MLFRALYRFSKYNWRRFQAVSFHYWLRHHRAIKSAAEGAIFWSDGTRPLGGLISAPPR